MSTETENKFYPTDLNPFGDDDSEATDIQLADGLVESSSSLPNGKLNTYLKETDTALANNNQYIDKKEYYPPSLDPFAEDEEETEKMNGDEADKQDYDDSLNPFGCDEEDAKQVSNGSTSSRSSDKPSVIVDSYNPFDEAEDDNDIQQEATSKSESTSANTISRNLSSEVLLSSLSINDSQPPVPMPRTKSLLKKQNRQVLQSNVKESTIQIPKCDLQPMNIPRRKRVASPINKSVIFMNNVPSTIEDCEKELIDIGDKLSSLEVKLASHKDILLKTKNDSISDEFNANKQIFIEFLKEKCLLVKRQKELMYKRRELVLDSLHAEIDSDFRKISTQEVKSDDDKLKEDELLKKLVDIVEEKSDIIENLNKVLKASDELEIESCLAKLGLSMSEDKNAQPEDVNTKVVDKANCDKVQKKSLSFKPLTKFATLMPNSASLKSQMKLKKKFFKTKNLSSTESKVSSKLDDNSKKDSSRKSLNTEDDCNKVQ